MKRLSALLILVAAAGVVAAILSRSEDSEQPEYWSPVEPS